MTRRVVILNDGTEYVGPPLARLLVRRDHDIVVGDPAEALVDELEGLGGAVESVIGVRDLSKAESAARLVQAALDRFVSTPPLPSPCPL